MTLQEEILEYNKRCALFLGAIDNSHQWGFMLRPNELNLSFDLFNEKLFSNNGGSGWFIKDLKFHSDWNWIMEIIETIEKLPTFSTSIHTDLSDRDINDEYKVFIFKNHELIIGENGKTKKEAVIKAIDSFLKWYKENK